MRHALTLFIPLAFILNCTHTPSAGKQKVMEIGAGKDFSSGTGWTSVGPDVTLELTHASPNGWYIAFVEESGPDADGPAYAAFRIMDMRDNTYIFDKSMSDQKGTGNANTTHTQKTRQMRHDLMQLAEKKIKDLYLLKLESNPRFSEANVSMVKKYATGFGDDDVKDSILWNETTYDFQVNHTCKGAGAQNSSFTINGKEFYSDSRQPASRGCPPAYGAQIIYSVKGRLVFFLRNKGAVAGADRAIAVPVWDMKKIAKQEAATEAAAAEPQAAEQTQQQ